jgi:pyruvate/2-oxoglutarate dehydrogenase complex dihydrolipoamide dehydrogenase (E3) component
MRYLRSPGVHHVDLDPFALRRFASKGEGKRVARFVYPYDRPGLELFRVHTEHVVRAHGLLTLRARGRATALTRISEGYRVETDQGALTSRRVVLALGLGEQLCLPAWARAGEPDARIEHLFAPSFRRPTLAASASVAIVGGGISAAQLAGALVDAGVQVTMIARHAPRIHRFDSDPQWLGPKAMSGFTRTCDLSERRRFIATARHRGSMPQEIASQLRRQVSAGRVRWCQSDVVSAEPLAHAVRLHLEQAPHAIEAERVVLATGFETHRPGAGLLDDEAIDRLGLACAACGYPIVSPRLEWAKGLFVSGPLAELELGPSARNIAGARAAAERLQAVA